MWQFAPQREWAYNFDENEFLTSQHRIQISILNYIGCNKEERPYLSFSKHKEILIPIKKLVFVVLYQIDSAFVWKNRTRFPIFLFFDDVILLSLEVRAPLKYYIFVTTCIVNNTFSTKLLGTPIRVEADELFHAAGNFGTKNFVMWHHNLISQFLFQMLTEFGIILYFWNENIL